MIANDQNLPVALVANVGKNAGLFRNDPLIWKWCRQYTLISEAGQKAWMDAQEKDPTIKMFGVGLVDEHDTKTEGDVYCYETVGTAGFTSIDHHNKNAEFSLFIAAPYQRRGYARKALELLLLHGFMHFGFRKIWGEVFEGNPAMKLFKELGFQEEGYLREHYWNSGRFINCYRIGMLGTDWAHDMNIGPDGNGKKRKTKLEVV